jgi:hypothetical protein
MLTANSSTGSRNMHFPDQVTISYNPKEICTFLYNNYFPILCYNFKFTFLSALLRLEENVVFWLDL